jgi:hypothetical protein
VKVPMLALQDGTLSTPNIQRLELYPNSGITVRMARQMKGPDGLTTQQRRYVEARMEGKPSAEAYVLAYPAANMNLNTIRNRFKDLNNHPAVKAALNAFQEQQALMLKRAALRQSINKDKVSAELAMIAFCRGVLLKADGWGDDRVVATSQVRRALMDLATLHGYIVERRDVRVIRSIEDLSDEEIAALAGDREGEHGTRH